MFAISSFEPVHCTHPAPVPQASMPPKKKKTKKKKASEAKTHTCGSCDGTGMFHGFKCMACSGTGSREGENPRLALQAPLTNAQVMVLPGQNAYENFANSKLLQLYAEDRRRFHELKAAGRLRYAQGEWRKFKKITPAKNLNEEANRAAVELVGKHSIDDEVPASSGEDSDAVIDAPMPPASSLPTRGGFLKRVHEDQEERTILHWATNSTYDKNNTPNLQKEGVNMFAFLASLRFNDDVKKFEDLLEFRTSALLRAPRAESNLTKVLQKIDDKKKKIAGIIAPLLVLNTAAEASALDAGFVELCAKNIKYIEKQKSVIVQLVSSLKADVLDATKLLSQFKRQNLKVRTGAGFHDKHDESPKVQFGDAYGMSMEEVLEMMYKFAKKKDMHPLSCGELASLNISLAAISVVNIKDVPGLINKDCSEWLPGDWAAFKGQLLRCTRSMLLRHLGTTFLLSHSDYGSPDLLLKFKEAMEVAVLTVPQSVEKKIPKAKAAGETRGRKPVEELFPTLVPELQKFVENSSALQADLKRRTDTSLAGFSIRDAQQHAWDNVPGLYEHGIDERTIHRLFQPPRANTKAGSQYKGLINARVAPKQNSYRHCAEGVHYARAQQNMFAELFTLFGQPCFSGDDMNIIQVGRPAVSRYHQNRRFFPDSEGFNHAVHDFPVAELGIKLGGFMLRGGSQTQQTRPRSWSE